MKAASSRTGYQIGPYRRFVTRSANESTLAYHFITTPNGKAFETLSYTANFQDKKLTAPHPGFRLAFYAGGETNTENQHGKPKKEKS